MQARGRRVLQKCKTTTFYLEWFGHWWRPKFEFWRGISREYWCRISFKYALGGTYRRPLEGRELSKQFIERPTTVYMRADWEKLSDEKSSLRACRRRIPNRSRVVSCESRIVHMFTCFTTSAFTLYTRVIGVVESPTTVYMRDDWEKLSDEKCSTCAMIGTS